MKMFEKYYGPDMELNLFRSDWNPPEKRAASALVRPQMATCLRYLDEVWGTVPQDQAGAGIWTRVFGDTLNKARVHAVGYVTAIGSCNSASEFVGRQQEFERSRVQVEGCCEELRQLEFLATIYRNQEALQHAQGLLDVTGSFNARAQELIEALGVATKGFEDRAQKALDKIESIANGVKTTEEEAARTLELAKKHYADQALTAFAKAFETEAEYVTKLADAAQKSVWIVTALTGVSIFAFAIAEHFSKTENYWKWLSLRVVIVALAATLLAYFMRERRNFMHVAVSNRHRKNLCTAYLAIAESMRDEERLKYLGEILPHLSALGKTGFIVKEDVPELPHIKAAQLAAEVFAKAKHDKD